VLVGVDVGVLVDVGVDVGVLVGVAVATLVGVDVGVLVGVDIGIVVGVAVGDNVLVLVAFGGSVGVRVAVEAVAVTVPSGSGVLVIVPEGGPVTAAGTVRLGGGEPEGKGVADSLGRTDVLVSVGGTTATTLVGREGGPAVWPGADGTGEGVGGLVAGCGRLATWPGEPGAVGTGVSKASKTDSNRESKSGASGSKSRKISAMMSKETPGLRV